VGLCGVSNSAPGGGRYADKRRLVKKTVRHTADVATLTFMSSMNGCPGDESWGIRNIKITAA